MFPLYTVASIAYYLGAPEYKKDDADYKEWFKKWYHMMSILLVRLFISLTKKRKMIIMQEVSKMPLLMSIMVK
ncbi:hypothetical protein BACCAP_04336 [Pseudoflavonifractor capillosus ATCC 29799]|uniref:Uncharacterized protein n=1 Tax=Pseudoflavonifractor capillosus ATCC 29799 TaxID=411467 RepID=A6P1G9_9FIRM|nr:hypothetical protein BACCAP_04336 [Pseudoflavonifractor capillosus ATCC 29799]